MLRQTQVRAAFLLYRKALLPLSYVNTSSISLFSESLYFTFKKQSTQNIEVLFPLRIWALYSLRRKPEVCVQFELGSKLGFAIPSRASISSLKEDSRKDRIRRRVSRTNKIQVKRRKLAKLDKIGMGIGTCIDVPDRLMLPG